jgi:hypothetical protein
MHDICQHIVLLTEVMGYRSGSGREAVCMRGGMQCRGSRQVQARGMHCVCV